MKEEKQYWLALNRVKQIGSVRFKALIESFGNAKSAWEASESALRATGLGPKIVSNLIKLRETYDFDSLITDLKVHNVRAITWEDADYPNRLREINQSPPVIYLRGDLIDKDDWAIAVVGTRKMTRYGHQIADELGIYLASQGITVVSGLAHGIDAATQQAAIQAGGRSIAVLAHGLDNIYPSRNQQLGLSIEKNGALVSDYALGTPADASNFPPRNRIIAALARATVVIEAGQRSGALITARFAVEQGRDVFAVPGSIYGDQSKGPNQLIRDGAHPLLHFDQLLEALDLEFMQQQQSARKSLPKDAIQAKLYGIMSPEPMHVNEIGNLAEMPIDKVSSALALMELKGMVRQVGGMNYVLVRELRAPYGTS
jgi:DNA processing protein